MACSLDTLLCMCFCSCPVGCQLSWGRTLAGALRDFEAVHHEVVRPELGVPDRAV